MVPEKVKRKSGAGRRSKAVTPVPWSPPSEKDLIHYANLRHSGISQAESYRKVFPKEAKLADNTLTKKAIKLERTETISVRSVIKMMHDSNVQQLNDEVDGLSIKRELVEDLVNGIRSAVEQGPLAIHTCIHTVRALADLLGLDTPKEINVKGQISHRDERSQKQPPALADMTDEELDRRIRELSGK